MAVCVCLWTCVCVCVRACGQNPDPVLEGFRHHWCLLWQELLHNALCTFPVVDISYYLVIGFGISFLWVYYSMFCKLCSLSSHSAPTSALLYNKPLFLFPCFVRIYQWSDWLCYTWVFTWLVVICFQNAECGSSDVNVIVVEARLGTVAFNQQTVVCLSRGLHEWNNKPFFG